MNRRNGFVENIIKIFRYAIFLSCFTSVLYLTLLSLFSTSSVQWKTIVPEEGEPYVEKYNFFVADRPFSQLAVCGLAVILLFGACFYAERKNLNFSAIKEKSILFFICRYRNILISVIFFAVCLCFILVTRLEPVSDPSKILRIARGIAQNDLTQFQVGGYMHRYPDQTGIVLVFYWIHRLFGEHDFLIIQIVNAALLTGAYYIMGRISEFFWGNENKGVREITEILCILFLPLGFYVTFIYGMIPGFCFFIFAFYMQLQFMDTGKMKYAVAAAVFIGLAIQFKTNSLVMLIAMVVFLFYDAVTKKRKIYTLAFLFLIIFCNVAFNLITGASLEKLTGVKKFQGMPKTAWIAMGLQESAFAPGVWNGYSVGLYGDNNYDYSNTNAAAIESIKNQMEIFWHDKSYGLDFFGRKNAMQWNEPTFQGLSVLEGRKGNPDAAPFLENLCSGSLSYYLSVWMNYYQTFILIGAILFFFLGKKYDIIVMLPLLALTGGMIFHTFWEAKPQYVLPYFMLLIPYCAVGYLELVHRLQLILSHKLTKEQGMRMIWGTGISIGLLFLLSMFAHTRAVSYSIALRDEASVQIQYDEAVAKMKKGTIQEER